MPAAVIAEQLSKQYRLGELNRSVLFRDVLANSFKRWRTSTDRDPTIWAVKDISFSLEKGEVLGIVGRNGAGKSTLLKILSRITYPTTGSMTIRGRVASLLEVGTGFHEELTGRENIYLNGSILGMRKTEIDSRLDSIVDFSGVEQFLDTPVKRYSSGMRLRLGFAVAAHLEPDVMLVDEVLAVGDAGFQKKCIGAMNHLHAGGRTVMFVSHNLTAIENLCPRTIWIDKGIIRDDGESRRIIQSYLETFAEISACQADLTDMERKGSGQARFTRMELLDEFGQPLDVVRSGMMLIIRLHYRVNSRIHEPHFGIEILTNTGTQVSSVNTWIAGYNIESLEPGAGHIDVRIEALNLTPDRYYLSLWIASVGPQYYDQLDTSLVLDVEAADVHNSGRSMTSFGIVFFPCCWQHRVWRSGSESDAEADSSSLNDSPIDVSAG